ncbi:MAG: response regulator [Planctomycetota bacterium]
MLVLTRRPSDRVTFPDLGITLHFLRIRSGQARIGIDAPAEIRIQRGEEEPTEASSLVDEIETLPRRARHEIRNELHQISLAVHLYRELCDKGFNEEAEAMFSDLQDALGRLDSNQWLNSPKQKPKAKISLPEGSRIAVVEDDDNEREMLAGFLRLRGFEVDDFRDGQCALESLTNAHELPAAVLVDMQMPHCNGGETVRRLRANAAFQNKTIYAVSGCSPEEYGVSIGTAAGVDRWFPKPLNPSELLGALENKKVA